MGHINKKVNDILLLALRVLDTRFVVINALENSYNGHDYLSIGYLIKQAMHE